LAGGIFAALANPADGAYNAKLLTLLSASETDEATKDLRLLGRVLIDAKITEADRKSLGELVAAGVGGADPVALIALACRKAGGSNWEQFRFHSRELLGEQPLPGEVVVLVNGCRRVMTGELLSPAQSETTQHDESQRMVTILGWLKGMMAISAQAIDVAVALLGEQNPAQRGNCRQRSPR
jgi:hypothetical protein